MKKTFIFALLLGLGSTFAATAMEEMAEQYLTNLDREIKAGHKEKVRSILQDMTVAAPYEKGENWQVIDSRLIVKKF